MYFLRGEFLPLLEYDSIEVTWKYRRKTGNDMQQDATGLTLGHQDASCHLQTGSALETEKMYFKWNIKWADSMLYNSQNPFQQIYLTK